MAEVRRRVFCLVVVTFVLLCFLAGVCSAGSPCKGATKCAKFEIATEWNSNPIDHKPIKISLCGIPGSPDLLMRAEGPFFNDPAAPDGPPGKPFPKLWEYEVAEAFFLGLDNNYLEVEVSPHGQHLVLVLSGVRKMVKQLLPMKYSSEISSDNTTWSGEAILPHEYFPPGVNMFNAYAIHGSGDERTYESLYPTPKGKFKNPDFHRLEYFKAIDLSSFIKVSKDPSPFWKDILAHKKP